MGNPDFRGSPAGGQIRVRGTDCDRPASIRPRPLDPAGDGIASVRPVDIRWYCQPVSGEMPLFSPTRGSGCDSAIASSASTSWLLRRRLRADRPIVLVE